MGSSNGMNSGGGGNGYQVQPMASLGGQTSNTPGSNGSPMMNATPASMPGLGLNTNQTSLLLPAFQPSSVSAATSVSAPPTLANAVSDPNAASTPAASTPAATPTTSLNTALNSPTATPTPATPSVPTNVAPIPTPGIQTPAQTNMGPKGGPQKINTVGVVGSVPGMNTRNNLVV